MMMMECGAGGWGHWVWMAATFVFWALLITAVVLVVRYLVSLRATDAHPTTGATREEGLLAERYARGEIDDDEYKRRMSLLRQNR
jgi:putative membrane protein